MVDDIENLRKALNIDKWLVFGGSWGSTLALAYSQCHPNSVTEIILRGIFLLRKHELDWFYQYGASQIFPEAWEDFIHVIDEDQRENLMLAYQRVFTGDDEDKKLEAALAWTRWEAATSNLHYKESQVNDFSNPKFALEFAQIENHYFINKGFFNEEDQLLEGIDLIRHIPCVIVQGRYDVVCPISTAWELSKKWPEAEFIIAPNSGHSAFEVELSNHLVKITDSFA